MDVPPEEETDSNYEDEDDDDDDDDDDDYEDEFDEIPGPNDPGIIDDQVDDDLVDAILQQGRVEGGVDGGMEEARARAEIRMHAHLRATIANRRARFDENDGSLLRRTLKLLARVGIHHRVLLIFVIDGLLTEMSSGCCEGEGGVDLDGEFRENRQRQKAAERRPNSLHLRHGRRAERVRLVWIGSENF